MSLPYGNSNSSHSKQREIAMKDLSEKHRLVQETISDIDDLGFWFLNHPHYITDEIGIMTENAISRLQALESAIMIKIRQLAETKLAEAVAVKQKTKEHRDAVRKEVESKSVSRTSKPKPKPKAVPNPRSGSNRSRGSKVVKAKR